jgi:cephalosporin-C deacetylase-like acetyl esterase
MTHRDRLLNFATLLFLLICPFISAAESDPSEKPKAKSAVNLMISPDHPDGSYAEGEPVTWTIKVTGLKPNEQTPTPDYTVSIGKTEIASGILNFVNGEAKVTCTPKRPGVAELLVKQSTPWRPNFRCGAVVAWQKIRSTVAEPADFDAFWKKKLAELATIPMKPVLEEVANSGSPDVMLWKITLDGFRGSKIHGYLARPKGISPLPAQLQVQYWGVYPLDKKEVVNIAKNGWLALNIMAHDLPCDQDAAFYKNPGINTYVNTGADDPDKSYFLRMFLSCSRAVDYLTSRSDWNKSTMLVQGGSQGGFQGIATAALNPKVTALTVFVPGGGNLTGFLEDQPNGWPGWVYSKAAGAQRDAMIKTAGYYDTNNFAKRIKCPVLVGTGLIDTISRPETQFTMFNNLSSPKRMVLMPADEHTAGHGPYKTVQAAWWKAAAAGEPLPVNEKTK